MEAVKRQLLHELDVENRANGEEKVDEEYAGADVDEDGEITPP